MQKGKFGDITPKRKKVRSAVDDFIDDADSYQNQAQKKKEPTERLNVEIPQTMHKAIKLKAAENSSKIKDIVIQAINDHLKL